MMKKKCLLVVFTFALCLVLPLTSAPAEEDMFEALMLERFGEPVELPNFSLPSVDGGEVSLNDFKGNIIFLNFWATWCPYCRKERPALQALHDSYKDQGVVVVSVSIDRDSIAEVKKYVDKNELTFPNLHDPKSQVASKFGVSGVPVTFIIGSDGHAIGGGIGPRPWDGEEVAALVEQLLRTEE